jgi:hypothetical protein
MADIDDDIAAGGLPGSVASFTDLHDYVDANDYLQDAGVPMPTAKGGIDTIVAVQDEVTRRLRAPGRRHCTHGACPYPDTTTPPPKDPTAPNSTNPSRCAAATAASPPTTTTSCAGTATTTRQRRTAF